MEAIHNPHFCVMHGLMLCIILIDEMLKPFTHHARLPHLF